MKEINIKRQSGTFAKILALGEGEQISLIYRNAFDKLVEKEIICKSDKIKSPEKQKIIGKLNNEIVDIGTAIRWLNDNGFRFSRHKKYEIKDEYDDDYFDSIDSDDELIAYANEMIKKSN